MDRLFLGTNVLLDVLEKRAPWYTDAAECLARIQERRCVGAMTALSLSDISYVQRKASSEEIREAFNSLREFPEIASMDQTCVDSALSESWPDVEDSFQWHAAMQWGATHFLTRNLRDFPATKSMEVLTPNDYLTAR